MSNFFQRYIGVRDFFPEDTLFRNWMFSQQRKICINYGYEEYGGPLLEPLELYRVKSSEEIVNDQLYRFTDRGQREVALRPELTPTLARMVALRSREFSYPLRWFNIGNFMRYERPGRGRLREFFQLNVDLLGPKGWLADSEIIMLAIDILRSYGSKPEHYKVFYSDRRIMEGLLKPWVRDEAHLRAVGRVIDKRSKLKKEQFEALLEETVGGKSAAHQVLDMLALDLGDLKNLAAGEKIESDLVAGLIDMTAYLEEQGYGGRLRFDPSIVRGFDYYTAFIFEIFDSNPQNQRAIFGGGRYDRLMGLFGGRDIPAVGFGMGDVTLENFLRGHDLVATNLGVPQGISILLLSAQFLAQCSRMARSLREAGFTVEMALDPHRRMGKQIETAVKKNRRYVIILGEKESQRASVAVKDLQTGDQKELQQDRLLDYFLQTD